MFQVRTPFQVFVPATVTGSTLIFCTEPHYTLIRYQLFPGRLDVFPGLAGATPPWSVSGTPTVLPNAGVLKLKFDGAAMNALVTADAEDPTYLAFLDQRTIELEFAMRIGAPGEPPCDTDEILRCDLILKLGIVPE